MIEPGLWDMIMRLRSRGISDTRVIRAVELCPRSRFVPETSRDRAYDEAELPIPCGQVMLAPLLSAQMVQLLAPTPDCKVLVVGLGSGWTAGMIATMSKRVYAVERYQELVSFAEFGLARAERPGVVTRWGDGRYGWKGQAPFDRILVTCALAKVPKGLRGQLDGGGHMIAVVGGQLSRVAAGSVTSIMAADVPLVEPGKSAAL